MKQGMIVNCVTVYASKPRCHSNNQSAFNLYEIMFRLIHDLLIINNVDQISNFAIHMQRGVKKITTLSPFCQTLVQV